MKWPEEKEQQLAALYARNVPGSVIAKILGAASASAVYQRAARMGLSDPERSQDAAKGKYRDGYVQAYRAGQEARAKGHKKSPPARYSPAQRARWLAGWHDRDMEAA